MRSGATTSFAQEVQEITNTPNPAPNSTMPGQWSSQGNATAPATINASPSRTARTRGVNQRPAHTITG